MANLSYFPFFPGDWLKDPDFLQIPDALKWRAFLLRLRCFERGFLPSNLSKIANMVSANPTEFMQEWADWYSVLFKVEEQNGEAVFTSEFMQDLRNKALNKSDKAKEASNKRWSKRKQCKRISKRSADGKQALDCGCNPRAFDFDYDSGFVCGFVSFWGCGGLRRANREQADKAYHAKIKNKADHDQLMASTIQAINGTWKGREKKFIPHPATWINSGDWREDSQVDLLTPTGGNGNTVEPQGARRKLQDSGF